MHPCLPEFLSTIFYEGTLQNGIIAPDRLRKDANFLWSAPDTPMLFYQNLVLPGPDKIVTKFFKVGVVPVHINIVIPYEGQRCCMVMCIQFNESLKDLCEDIEVVNVDAFIRSRWSITSWREEANGVQQVTTNLRPGANLDLNRSGSSSSGQPFTSSTVCEEKTRDLAEFGVELQASRSKPLKTLSCYVARTTSASSRSSRFGALMEATTIPVTEDCHDATRMALT
ncbi:hypothetical protein EDB19DRAFT_1915966 [Suillus lakei]|nr:hypothetical protein EDB19DRAFT_1915966 [Suillus lakei]